MSDTSLTRCPHCNATFKVTASQLEAAKGKVRCGACMKVFVATEHLVGEKTDQKSAAPAQATPPQVEPKAAEPAAAKPSPKVEKAIPERAEPVKEAQERVEPHLDDGDLIFQDDPDEDAQDNYYQKEEALSDDLSDSFKELEDWQEGDITRSFERPPAQSEEEKNHDESWAEEMLEEMKTPASKPPAPKPAPAAKPAPEAGGEPAKPAAAERPKTQFQQLRPDPVAAVQQPVRQRSVVSTLVWSVINISLLVVLAAQLAWFHFDKLARIDELRPLYAQACKYMGCELPTLADTSLIQSRNLVVRSHPTVPKALIIDTIITNQAAFDQPFPDISLQFSDLNNKVIAQRLFTPQEYLAGEGRALSMMPAQTPIHISLEIIDPGKAAVNYAINFHPPAKAE